MTSLFSFIAHEDANDQSKLRKAMALSHQRVEDRFGQFVRKGSVEDQGSRFSLVEEDIRAVVSAACEQVGYADVDSVLSSIGKNFVTADATPQLRTAGVRHEARKPKMCPYHSEVTDISLAQGEAQAGFNAMAQHAWSAKHCQGEGYEGSKCNFKPAMTTQAFWDEKAEKAEERKQERAEQAEREQAEDLTPVTDLTAVPDNADVPLPTEQVDIVEHSEPIAEPVSETPQVEVPMAMAASVKTADQDNFGGKGETTLKTDRRNWRPKLPEGIDDPKGRNPSKLKDVVEPISQTPDTPDNKSELKEIGEQVTEHQDVTQKSDFSRSQKPAQLPSQADPVTSSLLPEDAVREALNKFKR